MPAPRVLVVDDNAMNLELAVFVLDQAGLVVAGVADPGEVLALVAEFRPDLIVMDIRMPGLDGLSLTHRLKQDPASRDIVVIACTAHAMKGDEDRMRAQGCDGYIAKPIDVGRFADQVRAHLPGCIDTPMRPAPEGRRP